MSVAIDVASNFVSGTALTATTSTFTPAANTLLVAVVSIANGNDVAGAGSSVVTDSRAGTWTLLCREAIATKATAEVWCRDGGTSLAMTVTATSQVTGQIDVSLQVWSLTGAAVTASQTGATKVQNTSTSSAPIVTTTAGALVFGAFAYTVAGVTLTANGITTIGGQFIGTAGDTCASFRATSVVGTPGSTTLGFSTSLASACSLSLVEILPPSGSTPVSGTDTSSTANTGTLVAAQTGTDTSTDSDSGTLATAITGTDAPTAANSGTLAAGLTGTDTSIVAESGSVGTSSADTSTGADTGTVVAGQVGTDAGVGTNVGAVVAGQAGTDVSAVAEAGTLATALSDADASTLVDAGTTAVGLSGVDTSTGADFGTLAVAQVGLDTSAADSVPELVAALSGVDVGAVLDLGSIVVFLTGVDTGAMVDSGSVNAGGTNPTGVDSSAATDSSAVLVTLTGVDTSTGADVGGVAATAAGVDQTTVVESSSIGVAVSGADSPQSDETSGLSVFIGSVSSSIFVPPVLPAGVAGSDSTVVLGEVFYLESPQTVLGIRYYCADATWDGYPITVALYDPSGSLLATGSRVQQGSDPVGMISVLFPMQTLALLGPGNLYTVAFMTGGSDLGHYTYTLDFFDTQYVNGPYTVPAGGGRFRYVIGGVLDIPDHGTNSSYFVDLVSLSGDPVTDSVAMFDTGALGVSLASADSGAVLDTSAVRAVLFGSDAVTLVDVGGLFTGVFLLLHSGSAVSTWSVGSPFRVWRTGPAVAAWDTDSIARIEEGTAT